MRAIAYLVCAITVLVFTFTAMSHEAMAKLWTCGCTYPTDHETASCRGMTTLAGAFQLDDDASNFEARDRCQEICIDADLSPIDDGSSLGGATTSVDGVCDYKTSDNCASPKNDCGAERMRACFCDYRRPASEDPRFGSTLWMCWGEKRFAKMVDQNTDCSQICKNVGLHGGTKTNRYEDICDIRPPEDPDPNLACHSPQKLPEAPACQACFCKYKSGGSMPSDCVGKPFLAKYTSQGGSHCSDVCRAFNSDVHDPVIADPNAVCYFHFSTSCKQPENPTSPDCTEFLTQQQKIELAQQIELQRGSAASLPLPFSDISGPALVGRIIRSVLGIVGALAFGSFIAGGIMWMTAAGSEERIARARGIIVWSALGLVVIFAAYAITNFLISALAG